jgi:hypothetical protein
MKSRRKKIVVAILAVAGLYAFAPFGAGLFNTYDRRGPKLFVESHHELLYMLGYHTAGHHRHDGKPRVPFMQERSWFYGIAGRRTLDRDRQIREKLEAISQQR